MIDLNIECYSTIVNKITIEQHSEHHYTILNILFQLVDAFSRCNRQ